MPLKQGLELALGRGRIVECGWEHGGDKAFQGESSRGRREHLFLAKGWRAFVNLVFDGGYDDGVLGNTKERAAWGPTLVYVEHLAF